MRFRMLGSGSKGNALIIQTESRTLLIDAGLPVRLLKERLEASNVSIDAILITHEHSDHTKALKSLLKTMDAHVYLTEKTAQALAIDDHTIHFITPYMPFYIGDVRVMPYSTRHDAIDPVGYIIQEGPIKLVHMVDTGYVPEKDHALFINANAYIIESNYDVQLLFDSKRPYYLKKRIDSPTGHLSNHDASYHLSQWMGDATKVVCFAHPSEDCNTEDLIHKTFQETLTSFNIQMSHLKTFIATQELCDWVTL